MNMEQTQNPSSRKKFICWGAAAFTSLTVFRLFRNTKKKKSETVKMLTQDGRLVEINKELLAPSSKKISDKELQRWVKK